LLAALARLQVLFEEFVRAAPAAGALIHLELPQFDASNLS